MIKCVIAPQSDWLLFLSSLQAYPTVCIYKSVLVADIQAYLIVCIYRSVLVVYLQFFRPVCFLITGHC